MFPSILDRRLVRPICGALIAATLAACSSGPPPAAFDLTAPRQSVGGGGVIAGQLVVTEPVAIQVLEGDRILVRDAAGAFSFLGGGQWADQLPALVQARLIQTFENASRLRAVSRPGDRVVADFQLNTDLRAFYVDAATGEAVVEISAKVVNDRSGRIAFGRVFSAREPVGTLDAPNAVRALDTALSRVLLEIVRWAGTGR